MHFAAANGMVIHTSVEGPAAAPAEAPVLVFANSLGTDLRVWHGVAARLGQTYRIVRYDKRGHGLSSCPPAPYRLDDHVADLAALLDRLEISRTVVVGLSVGGMIALGLAVARPDLVRGLVLSDTAHRIGTPETWEMRIAAIRADGIAAMAETIVDRWFSAAYRAHNPDDMAGWRHMLTRTPVEGYLGTCMAIRDADLTETARRIAVPALCLAGSEDVSTPPELVRSLAELIPGAGFEMIDGVGHLPCVEAPDTVADLIAGFLQEASLA